jgi:hypothetical protein
VRDLPTTHALSGPDAFGIVEWHAPTPGGLPKTAHTPARRALVEGAWASRSPANVRRPLQLRLDKLPTPIQDTRWKAQVRLCTCDRQLSARGKNPQKVVVAMARERSALMWAMPQQGPVMGEPLQAVWSRHRMS